jgi:hypothetical protein
MNGESFFCCARVKIWKNKLLLLEIFFVKFAINTMMKNNFLMVKKDFLCVMLL